MSPRGRSCDGAARARALCLCLLPPRRRRAFGFLPAVEGFNAEAAEGIGVAGHAGRLPPGGARTRRLQPRMKPGRRPVHRRRPARPRPRTAARADRKPDRASPVCSQADFHTPRARPGRSLSGESCPDRTPGRHRSPCAPPTAAAKTRTFGLFNLQPPPGRALGARRQPLRRADRLHARRPPGRGRIRAHPAGPRTPPAGRHHGLTLTIWGVPWEPRHDDQRGNCLNEAEPGFGWAKCSVGRPRAEARRAPT